MSDQALQFQNEDVSVNLTRKPLCKIEAEVTVSPAAAKSAYAAAVKNIKKEVALPGFRKGKAPDAMIISNYEPHVEREFKDVLAQTSFQKMIDLVKIPPLNREAVSEASVKNHSKDGAVITFKYECRPEAPEINPQDLSIPQAEIPSITDKEIDEEIENLRFQHADWTDVEGRAVQDGDYLVLDIDLIDEPAGNLCTDKLFEMKKGEIGAWLYALLVGQNIGATVEGMSEQDEGHKTGDFKPRQCRITIKKIRHATLPPVDDALAQKARADNVQELRSKIRSWLEKDATRKAQEQRRVQLTQLLFEKYPFELPQSLVQQELKIHLKNTVENLQTKDKMTREEIESKRDEIINHVTAHVVRQLHLFFLTEKHFAKMNMEISKQEMIEEFVQQMSRGESTFSEGMDPKEVQSRLYVTLMTNKVIDHLLTQSTSK